jgi:cytochrome c556
MKRLALAALATATLFTALPAAAQFAKPEDAIKYRKGAMFVMGQHFGRIGAMAQGKVPFDAAAAAANADVVASLSKLPFAGFAPGTDSGDTSALPEVWLESEKFKAGAQKMQDDVAKLATAAKSGNLDQLKAAFGEAGKTCKGCHDHFKKK